jgi:hypothetical protein
MSGFDVAAGVVGFASLGVILLQGCIKGFVLLSTAQNFRPDAELIRCEIEFQQYRLFQWAEQVGLQSKSPKRNLNWEIITDLLKRIESLMTDTTNFKEKYNLEVVETHDTLTLKDLEPPKTGLRWRFSRDKPGSQHRAAQTIGNNIKMWRRLKWATMDKEGIERLISHVSRFIDKLYDLLQADDQQFMRSGMEALLRHFVSQATEPAELADLEELLDPKYSARSRFENGAIKTAANLKQKRLMIGFNEDDQSTSTFSVNSSTTLVNATNSLEISGNGSNLSSSISPSRRAPKVAKLSISGNYLSYKLLVRSEECIQTSPAREMAIYDHSEVLIEWKRVERGIETKLKHRIKSLTALLQEVDNTTFHSLRCRGYLKDSKTGHYGYVFEPPQRKSGKFHFTTLNELLASNTTIPCLNIRINLAVVLVESVLQLHTSGWLHKGIRSDNIVLFQQGSNALDVSKVFLEGYEYARADNPSDMTEDPRSEQEANLYRHPQLLRSDRASFCKAFDLYALGCVMMELGFWQNLTTILLHLLRNQAVPAGTFSSFPVAALSYNDKAEMAQINKSRSDLLRNDNLLDSLRFMTGRTYVDVVLLCLSAADSETIHDDDEDEDDQIDDSAIDIELQILERLKSLMV